MAGLTLIDNVQIFKEKNLLSEKSTFTTYSVPSSSSQSTGVMDNMHYLDL